MRAVGARQSFSNRVLASIRWLSRVGFKQTENPGSNAINDLMVLDFGMLEFEYLRLEVAVHYPEEN